MKKIISAILILLSGSLFAQENNEDYFQIGVYGGEYQSFASPFYEPSYVINTIGIELENIKSKHIGFYVKASYQNTYNEIQKLLDLPPFTYDYKNPRMYRFILNFGVKYYTRMKSPQIYFNLGLSHENLSVGEYSYTVSDPMSSAVYGRSSGSHQYNKLFIDCGTGLKFKLSNKISLDLQYSFGINFEKRYNTISSNTILAGIKYTL